MADEILIAELELSACIGVPAAERAMPQRLTANLRLEPANSCAQLGDDINRAVDYAAVAAAVQALCHTGERRLIETLAEEIAALVLQRFAVGSVEVELRKFVLPATAYVAVRIRRSTRPGI